MIYTDTSAKGTNMPNNSNQKDNHIFSEKFDSYKEGVFSEEPSANRETHFIEKLIEQGPWTIISTYHTDSFPELNVKWIIKKNKEKKILVQTGVNKEGVINLKYFIKRYLLGRDVSPILFFPAMVVGKETWRNKNIDTIMTPLSKKGLSGILFNAKNSMQHYMCGIKKDKVFLLKRSFNSLHKIASSKVKYEKGKKLHLSVRISNDIIDCFVDGIKKISVKDSTFDCGKSGIFANVPTEFESFSVEKDINKEENKFLDKKQINNDAKNFRSKYPGLRLVKKVELPAKCSGRSIRFGDLSGEGQIEYLIVHGLHPMYDSGKISMTATDSSGRIMWQKGEPGKEKNIYPFDFPVQIYDIDNDGKNEVICEFGGFLQILDGKTGNIKNQIDSPRLDSKNKSDLSVLDSIYICNLSGKTRAEDLLIKDMYSNIYAYNNNFDMLWSYQCNTGHYPFTYDLNGDGRENVLIGYTLLNPDGKKIWELKLKDHADAVAIFKSDKTRRDIVAIAGSNEGFIIANTNGKIIKHLRIGHMQTITVANLLPDSKDYQIATNTYWGNPGIIYILDFEGNIINIFQPSINGSPISPVKWTNDNNQLILLSAAKGSEGGLYDGYGQQAVSFPDDGHPYLCYQSLDIDQDGLDEILCWDHDRLWIYRSEELGTSKDNHPIRLPSFYNQSNFRANVSIL